MSVEQLDLLPERRDPSVAAFKVFLRGRGWVRARDVSARTGWTDRELRNIAEADAVGEIITGNAGYKLLAEATVAEVKACADRLGSQARKMEARRVRMLRAYHEMTGATAEEEGR